MSFFTKKPATTPEYRTNLTSAHAAFTDSASIDSITEVCQRAAQGDLEARILGLSEHPQLGGLCRSINAMLDMADSFVRESGAAMACFSKEEYHRPILLRGMKGAYRSSAVIINIAGTQMKASSESLALVASVAANNLLAITTVAAACEELHATGNQISHKTNDSMQLSETSFSQGEEALKTMENLSTTFRQIDNIVALILNISERTNLLALNASIESTRAGEHGARFGIIAKEVKELAKNSASATESIRHQVNLMREAVENVNTLIHTIHNSLSLTSSSSAAIAGALSEQVSATDEINRQIHDLTTNAQLVADQIAKH